LGWSGIVFNCSVVCPLNGRISCCSFVSSVVAGLWLIAVLLWMFFIVLRLSSMNLCGNPVSSRVSCGKLYLLVACVYCGC